MGPRGLAFWKRRREEENKLVLAAEPIYRTHRPRGRASLSFTLATNSLTSTIHSTIRQLTLQQSSFNSTSSRRTPGPRLDQAR